MSLQRRRRRREFERGGGPSEAGPNRRLPPAQERVQQAIEASALGEARGVSGDSPMQGAQVFAPPGAQRAAVRARTSGIPQPIYGVASPLKARLKALKGLRYRFPARTLVCHQRQVRKEVLFARRVAGFRRSAPGRGGSYRRRPESQYGC